MSAILLFNIALPQVCDWMGILQRQHSENIIAHFCTWNQLQMTEFRNAPCSREKNNNNKNSAEHATSLHIFFPGSRSFWAKHKKMHSILQNLQEVTFSQSSPSIFFSRSLLSFLLLCVFSVQKEFQELQK